jgi:hypothetical protein
MARQISSMKVSDRLGRERRSYQACLPRAVRSSTSLPTNGSSSPRRRRRRRSRARFYRFRDASGEQAAQARGVWRPGPPGAGPAAAHTPRWHFDPDKRGCALC